MPKPIARILQAAVLFVGLLTSSTAMAQSRVVVFDLAADGATDEQVTPFVVKAALQGALDEAGLSILSTDERKALLNDARGLGVSCQESDADCWGKVGILGEVGYFAFPKLKGARFSLVVIDVTEGDGTRVAERQLTPANAALEVRSAVIETLSPDKYVGNLTVRTTPSGALIRIDGEEVATSPLVNAGPFSAGHRVVQAVLKGKSIEERVFIPLDGHAEVHLSFVEQAPDGVIDPNGDKPTSPTPKAPVDDDATPVLFYTGAGLTAVSVAGVVVTGLAIGGAEIAATALLGSTDVEERKEHPNGALLDTLEWVSVGSTAGLVVFGVATVASAALLTTALLVE